mmetsp:Transcript_46032/g.103543  ORF Transcript_46032/g.103543 Transcript_46032/m.103543 type:complete len:426 (-) Transcript_46032:17-1294(-)|eukprot:CAMPEP_0197901196 /NCGR_PEP_ID=MMETSP1439-20131203/50876_1 /TAXON_ID=66791 /ORGANISM="Gonyaulax spinifera, Strain CCMP409" /LENGTH=425 /DNA_ID=CAMNT_0043522157 /DNA_START=86 /DNA_END=1363 /DNA_ORIENTATION=+
MAGTELPRVVDEEDEDEAPRAQAKGSWYDCTTWDWDKYCAYRTPKIVRIRDRQLGCLYWSMVTVIIMYIIIFVFHMEGRHTQQATGIGTVITKFKGKAFAGSKVFDGPDLRFPVIEPSGAFIMTRRIVVKDQTQGSCVDWDNPTTCPCPKNGKCTDGHCEVQGWCPTIGDFNTEKPPQGALVENITGLESSVLHISASIAFPSIGNRLFVMGNSPGAKNDFKTIKLGDLLKTAQPPVELSDILLRGALISVAFFWNCDVVTDCEPTVVIKRLDGGQGFQQKRAWTKRMGNSTVRDAMYMFGLRILVDSSGVGRRVSIPLIVLQMGSCLALLRVASISADFIMLKLYSKQRGEAYQRCKVTTTQDYSDLQDRINLIKDAEKQKSSSAAGPQLRQGKSGTSVPYGLGAGGRGGMASTILRGRNVGPG